MSNNINFLPLIEFVGLIILTYLLSYQIMHKLAQTSRKSYLLLRIILLPGVIIHETAHILACLATGTTIESFSFWSESGGNVVHHKPKFSVLIQPLIAFAPLPFGIIALLYLSEYLVFTNLIRLFFVIILMVSIAGTLAPSKADALAATEGSIVMALITSVTLYFYPPMALRLSYIAEKFNDRMLSVTIILLIIWLILSLLAKALNYRHRTPSP